MDLHTKRLHIRDAQLPDLAAMQALWTDPIVMRGMGTSGTDTFGNSSMWPATSEEVAIWLPKAIWHNEQQRPREAHGASIVEIASGSVIGFIGCGDPEAWGAKTSFGYALLSTFHGRGYATEALSAVVEFCLSHGASAVQGTTAGWNVASARVMEKAGLVRVGLTDEGEPLFRVSRERTA